MDPISSTLKKLGRSLEPFGEKVKHHYTDGRTEWQTDGQGSICRTNLQSLWVQKIMNGPRLIQKWANRLEDQQTEQTNMDDYCGPYRSINGI